MSEALCGPANPLQQFKQQTQLDRSLQQDRLATRHGGGQGFRSSDRNGHLLDAEFKSFQAGAPVSDLPGFHPQPLAHQAPFAAPVIPSWASDFQQLNISAPAHNQPQQTAFAPSGGFDWAADFRQHIQPTSRAQTSSPSPWAFQQRARYGMTHTFDNTFAQPSFVERPLSKGKSVAREEVDDAAFARAFDMLDQEHMEPEVQEHVVEGPQEQDFFDAQESMEDTIEKALKDSIFDPDTLLGTTVPEHDVTPMSEVDYNGAGLAEPAQQEESMQTEQQQDTRAEDDALAATAGELLERVKDNQSDKFQNSQFLVLMRKLKDREVRVDGDKMVETVGTTSFTWVPKREASPDSGYDSGSSTPSMAHMPFPHPLLDDHRHDEAIADCDLMEDHRWDHWESPYT